MNTQDILTIANQMGYKIVSAGGENWYLNWINPQGNKIGSYFGNTPDYQYDAAKEIKHFVS